MLAFPSPRLRAGGENDPATRNNFLFAGSRRDYQSIMHGYDDRLASVELRNHSHTLAHYHLFKPCLTLVVRLIPLEDFSADVKTQRSFIPFLRSVDTGARMRVATSSCDLSSASCHWRGIYVSKRDKSLARVRWDSSVSRANNIKCVLRIDHLECIWPVAIEAGAIEGKYQTSHVFQAVWRDLKYAACLMRQLYLSRTWIQR